MRIKKFIAFIIILIIGYQALQLIPPLLCHDYQHSQLNTQCPSYINDFVEKNPQAQELIDNYQTDPDDSPIDLGAINGIPLFIQWDKRWAYNKYGDEIVGTAGCGPTCMAMVAVGLTGNSSYNPRTISNYASNHRYLDGSMTTWTFMENGCLDFGIQSKGVPLDKASMINELNAGHPIICSMRPGDFTSSGHFIVLTKATNSYFLVNDPNSKENSHRQWTYQQLAPQIKAMWSYSLK